MKTNRPLLMLLLAVCAVLAARAGSGQASSASDQTAILVEDGRETIAFFTVPEPHVRDLVPPHYTLLASAPGTASVVVRTAQYHIPLGNGQRELLRSAVVAVEVTPPDGTGTANWYVLFWANSSPTFNDFLRRGTPGFPAIDVADITCSLTSPEGVGDTQDCAGDWPAGLLQFRAGPPTPSPFQMSGAISDSVVDFAASQGNYWYDVPEGTVKVFSHDDSFVFGPAAVTVSTPSDTQLAEILGAQARAADAAISEQSSGSYTKVVLDTASLFPLREPEAANDCTAAERRQFLAQEQTRILDLMRSYGDPPADLTTLRDAGDIALLAAGDPDSGTMYSLFTHQFVSFAGMGVAVLNTGELGPGKPDLLFYAPNPAAAGLADVTELTEPYGPDFPYTLAGWGYLGAYDHEEHPTFLGACIVRGDWFVHERGIHPAEDWTMLAVPPHEVEQGQDPGQDPILPTECGADPCPAGLPHARFWDIHFWLGGNGEATVGILDPSRTIAGIDPGIGVNFYYPDGGTVRETDCDVVDTVVRVPVDNVRPLVPAEFTLAELEWGKADLFIGGVHCQGVSINGGPPRETTWGYFRVAIEDPNQTNDGLFSDALNSELTHSYQFWLASDNPEQVAFFRSEGGVTPYGEASHVVHVGRVYWDYDPAAGTFRMEVPPPAPSPFRIEATITERVTPPGDVTIDLWAAVPRGVMELPDDNLDGVTSGFAIGQVFPQDDSVMDRVFCDDTDGSFGADSGSLDLHFTNSSYTLVVRDPFELFGVQELSDTGPATCNPGS